MRNPKRIKNILKNIEVIWEKYPDLRLGQLLINITSEDNFYYIEDEHLIRLLQEEYTFSEKKVKKPKETEIPDWGWWD